MTNPAGDNHSEDTNRPPHFFLLAILFETGLALLAFALGWLLGISPLATWRSRFDAAFYGVVATLPPLVVLWIVDRRPIGPLIELRRLVRNDVLPMFRGLKLWQLALIAASAGVGEEFLFRGLIQPGLTTVLAHRVSVPAAQSIALVVTSLLFGLMHPISKTYAALCALIGLYLGAIWLLTDNLCVPVLVHGLYDFAALVYLLREEA